LNQFPQLLQLQLKPSVLEKTETKKQKRGVKCPKPKKNE
jgi:hypothetical protein